MTKGEINPKRLPTYAVDNLFLKAFVHRRFSRKLQTTNFEIRILRFECIILNIMIFNKIELNGLYYFGIMCFVYVCLRNNFSH